MTCEYCKKALLKKTAFTVDRELCENKSFGAFVDVNQLFKKIVYMW